MTRYTLAVLTAVLASTAALTLTSSSQAAEGTFDASVLSAYVWRGQTLNDELVLQPGLTVAAENGLSANVWGNFDLTDNLGTGGEFSEIDLTGTYSLPLDGGISADVGVINYLFPQADNAGDLETTEVYLSAAVDTALSPSVGIYWDVDEAEGLYFNFGLSHVIDVIDDTMDVELGFGIAFATEDYNTYYFGVEDTALNDGNLSLSTSYALNEAVSLGAQVAFTWLWDSDIEEAAETLYGNEDLFYGGVSASAVF